LIERPPSDAPEPWHTLTADAVCTLLAATRDGLTQSEAASRLAAFGPNELQPVRRTSPWDLLFAQFKNVLIIILLIAALLSAFLGHGVEAITIGVIVLFAALLGFAQEYRAERAIEALRLMAAPAASVIRDGSEMLIAARDLVPGDLVLLRAGDKIPADLRLIEAINLQMEESALTGESLAVEKAEAPLAAVTLALGERSNMGYAGTAVSYGRGRGMVVATGTRTEFGKIAQMLAGIETGRTPLQENLDRVGRLLARAALIGVAIIITLGLIRGEDFVEMLIFGIALAVAVVPEALPAVVTISLALGVQRMVKRHALMRRLAAVETLGSTTVICSDKTGTLTRNEMTVRSCFVSGETFDVSGAGYHPEGEFTRQGAAVAVSGDLARLLTSAALACDAYLTFDETEGRWSVNGEPTEVALVVAAAKAGLEKKSLNARYPRLDEIPFTSESKRMTTLHADGNDVVAYAKGAPEVIMQACTYLFIRGEEVQFTAAYREEVLAASRRMAAEALRVLAVSSKSGVKKEDAEQQMTFLGLIGMIDPPRPEARAAIKTCREAGIKPVMITGDHPITAQAVARELGLLIGRAVTGAELDAMDDARFAREVESIEVYARVAPAHKLRVVTALQQKGHVVAMTGDGVNDAPALKKADIGIAMGITGTAVSKEAAAMTLTDDNFASIVAAVEEGRGIFDNIKKYLMYLLSSNVGEIGLMAGALLLGLPLPLGAVQILYVNLATDGLPALALAVDPPDADLMRRPPRDASRGIFTRAVVTLILAGGVWSTLANLALFVYAGASGRSAAEAMTMTFVSLVLIEFFKAYNFRSDRRSVLQHPFANRWLNLAVFWELLLLLAVIYLPALQKPFGTFSLSSTDWLIVSATAVSVVPVLELAKWLERRGLFGAIG
jgi:P-type Ca2+ transporter type 2C